MNDSKAPCVPCNPPTLACKTIRSWVWVHLAASATVHLHDVNAPNCLLLNLIISWPCCVCVRVYVLSVLPNLPCVPLEYINWRPLSGQSFRLWRSIEFTPDFLNKLRYAETPLYITNATVLINDRVETRLYRQCATRSVLNGEQKKFSFWVAERYARKPGWNSWRWWPPEGNVSSHQQRQGSPASSN